MRILLSPTPDTPCEAHGFSYALRNQVQRHNLPPQLPTAAVPPALKQMQKTCPHHTPSDIPAHALEQGIGRTTQKSPEKTGVMG